MWQRRTFHKCAAELRGISARFREAYLNKSGGDEKRRYDAMVEESRSGVEVLRTLALAIRSELDYGLTADSGFSVGALKSDVTIEEAAAVVRDYRPLSSQLSDFGPLSLRQGLNKVAHTNPTRSGFYVDANEHDLILSGTDRSRTWVAVLSLSKLCDAVESLPDVLLKDNYQSL